MKRLFVAAALAASLAAVASADEPSGYAGKGTLVVRTSLGKDSTVTVGGNIAFEERDTTIRVDVLSLAIPGMEPSLGNALGTELLPQGGFTAVYDRKTSAYVVWSNTKRNYYSSLTASATPAPTPSPAPTSTASASPSAGLLALFNFLKGLKDDKAFTLSLTLGQHATVNGHGASILNYQYLKQTKDGKSTDIHGAFAIADDLDGLPVQITASLKTPSVPESSMRLDFTQLAKASPDPNDFLVPSGYVRAASLGDVIGRVLPQ